MYVDTNMYEYGFRYAEDDSESLYVWAEVEEFKITGYKTKDD